HLCHNPIHAIFSFSSTSLTELYTLSLHDALPISAMTKRTENHACGPGAVRHLKENAYHKRGRDGETQHPEFQHRGWRQHSRNPRSEEHTSELQSRGHLVCRLLLEKKKKKKNQTTT